MIIDGKAMADAWLDTIAVQVRAMGVPLHLAAVCAGDDPGLKKFVTLKQKAAQSVGVQFSSYFFPSTSSGQVQAMETLRYLADDESVNGIFIELPLPADWNTDAFLKLIPPAKDVDALCGRSRVLAPAVLALQHVLEEYDINVHGTLVAVVGHGTLVGRPIAQWLRERDAKVSVVDIDTKYPEAITANADIVVCGAGKAGLVTGDWIKEGATVIDFGYTRSTNSGQAHVIGDVDMASVQKKAGLVTPVPGGMGPLVIAAVLENLVSTL